MSHEPRYVPQFDGQLEREGVSARDSNMQRRFSYFLFFIFFSSLSLATGEWLAHQRHGRPGLGMACKAQSLVPSLGVLSIRLSVAGRHWASPTLPQDGQS